jgi:uncharacterized UBP type Zn finger protein
MSPVPATCDHLDQIREVSPSDRAGCTQCLATGDRWMHLRLCLSCGRVACCDSSPNRHASRHAREAGHAIAASFEPDEDWAWCYVDDLALDVSQLNLPHRDPYPGEA